MRVGLPSAGTGRDAKGWLQRCFARLSRTPASTMTSHFPYPLDGPGKSEAHFSTGVAIPTVSKKDVPRCHSQLEFDLEEVT